MLNPMPGKPLSPVTPASPLSPRKQNEYIKATLQLIFLPGKPSGNPLRPGSPDSPFKPIYDEV